MSHPAPDARPPTDVAVVLDDRSLPHGLSLLRSAVRAGLLHGGSRVVVDISGVQRLSSPTVAALLWANRQCAQRGGSVVLTAPTDQTLAVLRRTGLADVIRVQPAGTTPARALDSGAAVSS